MAQRRAIAPGGICKNIRKWQIDLVIIPGVQCQKALWAYSGCDNVNSARENLRDRECTPNLENIGKWEAGIYQFMIDLFNRITNGHPATVIISNWAKRKGLTGVVWTALPPVNKFGVKKSMTSVEALDYLSSLQGAKKEKAKDYFIKTPSQVSTEIRRLARDKLGWADSQLPSELFED